MSILDWIEAVLAVIGAWNVLVFIWVMVNYDKIRARGY